MPLFVYNGFQGKSYAEAKLRNSSRFNYGLWESMVRCWRRDQASVLSGELKMSTKRAKMGPFTPKYFELKEK